MNTRWIILDAIQRRQRLALTYKGEQRLVEPYLLYATETGEEILHGWQISGHSSRGRAPHWINLTLAAISSAKADRPYEAPRPDYNPESPGFHKVIAFTPKGARASATGGAG